MERVNWMLLVITSYLFAIFVKWLFNFVRKCKALPSGPWGLPFIGYSLFLGSQPHVKLFELSKKYGKIFSVTLGPDTVVVLNDWESIKAAFVDQQKIFSGRPNLFLFNVMAQKKDVTSNDGPVWKKHRQITIQLLKDCGMGKSQMEERVMDMVQDVMDALNKADGQVQPMKYVFWKPLAKTIWKIIAGDDLDNCVVPYSHYENTLLTTVQLFNTKGRLLFNSFPWLRFVPPNGLGHWEFMRANDNLLSIMKKVIEQRASRFNEGCLEGYVDHFIAEINQQTQKNGELEPPYNPEYLLMNLWEFGLAGIETTNTTILWGLLFMVLNPEVQKKAQAEIDEVVGRHRLPNLSDTSRLPYTNAFIMEVHRKASLASLSLPHRATETTKVLGHTILRDTTIIQNIYAVHHDPKLWNDPQMFRPERFIDENNKAKSPPYLMPFSIGSRACLGQQLAEMKLRLIFYCIIHRFNFSLPPDLPPPSLKPIVASLILFPSPFSLLVHKRSD